MSPAQEEDGPAKILTSKSSAVGPPGLADYCGAFHPDLLIPIFMRSKLAMDLSSRFDWLAISIADFINYKLQYPNVIIFVFPVPKTA